MSVLTQTEMTDLMLDRCQSNVATDSPVSTAERQRFLNDAYADVWEISGGSTKFVTSATAWSVATTSTSGVMTGILTDINEVLHVFRSTASGSTGGAGDFTLDRVEEAYIQFLRRSLAFSRYGTIQCYAITRMATIVPGDVNKMRLDFWPEITGIYLPVHYTPQFTPLDGASVTTPDCNDLESRDIALIAAARLAPLLGRAELVPSILADISNRTQKALERKLSAMSQSKQDR